MTVKQIQTALKEGRLEDALGLFDEVIRANPTQPWYLINRGQIKYHQGRFSESLPDFDAALELDSESVSAKFWKGLSLYKLGQGSAAETVWISALQHAGDLYILSKIDQALVALQTGALFDVPPFLLKTPIIPTGPPASISEKPSASRPTEEGNADAASSATDSANDAESSQSASASSSTAGKASGTEAGATAAAPLTESEEQNLQLTDLDPKELDEFRARVLINCMKADVEHRKKLAETVKVEMSKEEMLMHNSGDEEIDKMLSLGYYHVNSNNYDKGIEIFADVIKKKKNVIGAYIGRGTCHIIRQQIQSAIDDFSEAIRINPKMSDAYTRRAQAYLLTGRDTDAIKDFSKALDISPPSGHSNIWNRRGLVYHRMQNFRLALVDFNKVIEKEPDNVATICLAGQCYMQTGDAHSAIRMFQRALAKVPHMVEALLQMGIAYRELGLAKPAIDWLSKAIDQESSLIAGFYMRGVVHHGTGSLVQAVQDFSAVIMIQSDSAEAHQMRGVCYHSLGNFTRALQDYNFVVAKDPDHVAYYQREFCVYMQSHLDIPFSDFNIEAEFDPYVKEFWGKRTNARRLPNFKPVDLSLVPNIPDLTSERLDETTKNLIRTADTVGAKIQLNTPGFFNNLRQFRAAGFAILHSAQYLSKCWIKVKKDRKTKVSFRDVFDCAVRWRRYSEPNDSVWWVDKLSQENFNQGWGPQTPMVNGQLNVIRYYPYYKKAFKLLVELTLVQCATDETRRIVEKVPDVKELRKLVQRDFWVTSECDSIVRPGGKMEATLLTVIDQQPDGVEFYIRTPGAKGRWEIYETEMDGLFKQLQDQATRPLLNQDKVTELIVYIVYYWFNFQPLTRGSAVVGYIMLHALFLSLDLEIAEPVPENIQFDWEAILTPDPRRYLQIISPWIKKSLKKTTLLKSIPYEIGSTFNTIRKVLTVLHPNAVN